MATETIRTHFTVPQEWTDFVAAVPAAANTPGFIQHVAGAPVEIIKGGTVPSANQIADRIPRGGEEWCEASAIWLRCRSREGATVLFVVTE